MKFKTLIATAITFLLLLFSLKSTANDSLPLKRIAVVMDVQIHTQLDDDYFGVYKNTHESVGKYFLDDILKQLYKNHFDVKDAYFGAGLFSFHTYFFAENGKTTEEIASPPFVTIGNHSDWEDANFISALAEGYNSDLAHEIHTAKFTEFVKHRNIDGVLIIVGRGHDVSFGNFAIHRLGTSSESQGITGHWLTADFFDNSGKKLWSKSVKNKVALRGAPAYLWESLDEIRLAIPNSITSAESNNENNTKAANKITLYQAPHLYNTQIITKDQLDLLKKQFEQKTELERSRLLQLYKEKKLQKNLYKLELIALQRTVDLTLD